MRSQNREVFMQRNSSSGNDAQCLRSAVSSLPDSRYYYVFSFTSGQWRYYASGPSHMGTPIFGRPGAESVFSGGGRKGRMA